jgi:hypothetical protein
MEIKASIIDYIGKYEDGILVSVGLMYKGEFFNSIFYYTGEQMIINVEDKMIEKMGYYIEEHTEYYTLMEDIINKVEPYESIINKIEDISADENNTLEDGE